MANTFKFKNEDGNAIPELVLKATGAADRMLLHNIANGTYGVPKVSSHLSKNGLTHELVFEFNEQPKMKPLVYSVDRLLDQLDELWKKTDKSEPSDIMNFITEFKHFETQLNMMDAPIAQIEKFITSLMYGETPSEEAVNATSDAVLQFIVIARNVIDNLSGILEIVSAVENAEGVPEELFTEFKNSVTSMKNNVDKCLRTFNQALVSANKLFDTATEELNGVNSGDFVTEVEMVIRYGIFAWIAFNRFSQSTQGIFEHFHPIEKEVVEIGKEAVETEEEKRNDEEKRKEEENANNK